MEIKLTSYWIFLHNSEVHCNKDAECYLTRNDGISETGSSNKNNQIQKQDSEAK